MTTVAQLALLELASILAGVWIALVLQILTGRIRMEGLLDNKETGAFDPARAQLLVTSVMVTILTFAGLGGMRARHEVSLPASEVLFVIGASEAIYLIGKLAQTGVLSRFLKQLKGV